MVNFCAVPSCSNRSDRDLNVSYHRLPINKSSLLISNNGSIRLVEKTSQSLIPPEFVVSTLSIRREGNCALMSIQENAKTLLTGKEEMLRIIKL